MVAMQVWLPMGSSAFHVYPHVLWLLSIHVHTPSSTRPEPVSPSSYAPLCAPFLSPGLCSGHLPSSSTASLIFDAQLKAYLL